MVKKSKSSKGRKIIPRDEGETNKPFPWEGTDERIKIGYNVRFSEPTMEKLRYVVKNTTYKSMQKFIMGCLESAIEKELKRLLN